MPTEPGAANGGMMQRDEYTPSPAVTIDVEAIDTHVEEIGPARAHQSRPGLRCQAWGHSTARGPRSNWCRSRSRLPGWGVGRRESNDVGSGFLDRQESRCESGDAGREGGRFRVIRRLGFRPELASRPVQVLQASRADGNHQAPPKCAVQSPASRESPRVKVAYR